MKDYLVILYYFYTEIADPNAYRDEHHLFCISNHLLGRVIVSPEGLNGTVSGLVEDCQAYMAYLKERSVGSPKYNSKSSRTMATHLRSFT